MVWGLPGDFGPTCGKVGRCFRVNMDEKSGRQVNSRSGRWTLTEDRMQRDCRPFSLDAAARCRAAVTAGPLPCVNVPSLLLSAAGRLSAASSGAKAALNWLCRYILTGNMDYHLLLVDLLASWRDCDILKEKVFFYILQTHPLEPSSQQHMRIYDPRWSRMQSLGSNSISAFGSTNMLVPLAVI